MKRCRIMNLKLFRMNKILLLLAGVLMGTAAWSQENTIDEIIAVVGDKIILKSDIENQYAFYLRDNPPNEEEKCTLLQGLLYQSMLVSQAEIDSMAEKNPSFSAMIEEDLDRRIQVFVRSDFGTIEEMDACLKKYSVRTKSRSQERCVRKESNSN